jgi:hypothetical protein
LIAPILSDPDVYPSPEIIFSHIGKTKNLWQSLFEHIHTKHPDFSEEWRYYRDGKSWLMKITRKSKTIFWLSLFEHTFRTTFYFGDKAEDAIINSAISEELKKQFKDGKHYGKIRGLTIVFREEKDVENAKELVGIKLSMK